MKISPKWWGCAVVLTGLVVGCGRNHPPAEAVASGHSHEHVAPHGGTPIALGDEAFHLELVRNPANGTLQAYVLDGEMEKFIRIAALRFEIKATVGGVVQVLDFVPFADSATGETMGDTSRFMVEAEWLKTTDRFEGELTELNINGTVFRQVRFRFPEGNESEKR